jgi:glycosyltransferase involved in cell wall biosynthesis
MKILLIDVNCKYSSTGKIVYDLYNDLNSIGHTAKICYGRGALIAEPNIHKFSSNVETYAHAFLTRITGLTGIYSPFATNNLIKIMDEFQPDIVHIHELHGYFVNIAPVINYLKEKDIKTVWTFHCEFMYTGKCGHAYECEQWKSECDQCPHLNDYPSSLFFDFTKKMFNNKKSLFSDFSNLTIATPSKWLANRTKESFLNDKDIRVVHNGIDTENIFYPREFQQLKLKHNLSNEKIILSVAPNIMDERKGGRLVLEIAKRFQGQNIKFILIGVDDISEKFDKNIIALGRTSNQIELAEYYSMADIFLICSKRENFPTTCIEALSCGTPVIGFDEGGTKETAPEGYGIFVRYGEIDAISNEIDFIINDQQIIKTKAECALFGKEHYSKETMSRNYFNIYSEKLERF